MSKQMLYAFVLTIVSLNSFAFDQATTVRNTVNAVALAEQGDFDGAYREIAWMLRDNLPSIRSIGDTVLKAYPAIATIRLAELSSSRLTEMACDTGVESAKATASASIDEVEHGASKRVVAETRARVAAAYATGSVADQPQCQAARRTTIEEYVQIRANIAEEFAKQAPTRIRALNINAFCNHYGSVLRGEPIEAYANASNLSQLFVAEANRRGAAVDKELVLKKQIRIGINQCTLYASWGYPTNVNRTVGSRGQYSQLVYGNYGPYVYLENGVVRSFQD